MSWFQIFDKQVQVCLVEGKLEENRRESERVKEGGRKVRGKTWGLCLGSGNERAVGTLTRDQRE